jgi:excisionase family DNA binding protein
VEYLEWLIATPAQRAVMSACEAAVETALATVQLGQQAPPAIQQRDNDLLTADELASLYGVTVRTIRNLATQGKLPKPIRVGRSVRWRRSDLPK